MQSRPVSEAVRETQARFFDAKPPLYPWPHLLRRHGLQRLYKPREAFWAHAWEQLAPVPGTTVLDLGCGTGIWLDRLAGQYGTIGVGLDVSRASLSTASQQSSDGNRYVCADAGRIPLPDAAFGLVLSLDTLEHVADQEAFLQEISRVLKPGGRVFLWSINRSQRFTWNWVLEKLGMDVFERVAHDPSLLPDPAAVANRLAAAGLNVESMHYFNAFFTLALDEAIMVGVDFLRRRGMFAEDSPIRNGLGQVFLMASHLATSMVWRFLNWMDRPWLKRGLSNGFLVLALREPFPEQAVASEPAVAQLRGPLAPLSLAAASTEFPGGS
jgi:2-polyprenyl-6-hydroxyphenyl methylase/3-demethylubiquinone-9 3-methyltransferase